MQALSALSLAIFTRPKAENGLGWSVEELDALLVEVKKEFKDKTIHAYWPMYVFLPGSYLWEEVTDVLFQILGICEEAGVGHRSGSMSEC